MGKWSPRSELFKHELQQDVRLLYIRAGNGSRGGLIFLRNQDRERDNNT